MSKDQFSKLRVRDADRSQQAILVAARDEFAQHGLGGARVDRIAQRVKLNKRLIYYYFASKDDLFLAVLERTYADIREAEEQLHLTDLAPAQAIKRLIAFTWDYYLAHAEFISLLNTANLHQAEHLMKSDCIRDMNSPLIQTLGEAVGGRLHIGRSSGDLIEVARRMTFRALRSANSTSFTDTSGRAA